MARNQAYRRAQYEIEEARRSGAKTLDLSPRGDAEDSEKLIELPESLGQLTQLQQLNLYDNQLRSVPEWLSQLTQLQRLDLSSNQVRVLPESLGQLTQVQSLDLSFNQLTGLPESLGQLKQLQSLELFHNELTVLPESLSQLTQLEFLSLGANELTRLPDTLGALRSLRILTLTGNRISEIPRSFSKLHNLESMWLDSNELRDLPASLAKLRRLRDLRLGNNPLNSELAAAYAEGLDAVKHYLRAKSAAQIVLNEAKLILVGEGEVGKSCLLGALRSDPWEEGRSTTHGIEIKSVDVTDPASGTEIRLNGWDFGGQRVYRPTHQLFFSAPAVYLVVWKPREGPQQGFVKEWIKLVKHREPDAKILVVATHGGPKERQPDIDREEIWDLFGKDTVIDFFHVDSKPLADDKKGTYKGINELKDVIAKVAASLPEVGRSVPKRWQDVRQALKQSDEAYLPLDRVLGICFEHKMSEEEAQDFVRISHRLGRLIHYGHDLRLKEMVILKPDWLATAVSFVLDDEETRNKHGLVKFTRLTKLWSDNERAEEFRYPAKVHPIFVALMERFDLSYRVAGSPLGGEAEETSLIAQLVPDVRPQADIAREWIAQPHSGDEQQIQICRIVDKKGQSASAEGLFYQLIVRLHKFSLGREDFNASVHWQRGLILDDDYNGRALLEHIGNDVRITVRAAYPGNLLAVLTSEVKWLVESFWEGLKCQVVVPCIEPCGKNQPGTGLFEVQKLVAFKRQGMMLFPCNVSGCDQAHEIYSLLQNAPAARRPSIESLLAEGFAEMRSRLDELRRQNLVLDHNLKRIMSQVEDAFRGVMQTMTDEGKDGPRLFSMEPLERSKFNPDGWVKKKFRVTLWCEHTRLPLPLLNNNGKEGVYEFDVTREWFATAAPFLKVLTGTLSLVLPVAASATKLALDEVTYKGLEKQLDLGKSCAEAMVKATDKTVDWFMEKEGPETGPIGVIHAHGRVLREFQTWLKKEDPGFGDLRKVLNKQQEFLWVHRDFEKEY
jgi:RocCOR-like putative regulator of kinase activity/DAPkinase-like Roc (Ras of Complex) protein/Leucine Rich Repeat (LRR) protein